MKDYEITLTGLLPFLRHGDRKQIANATNLTPDYVQKCLRLNGGRKSWKVLREAAKMTEKNKETK